MGSMQWEVREPDQLSQTLTFYNIGQAGDVEIISLFRSMTFFKESITALYLGHCTHKLLTSKSQYCFDYLEICLFWYVHFKILYIGMHCSHLLHTPYISFLVMFLSYLSENTSPSGILYLCFVAFVIWIVCLFISLCLHRDAIIHIHKKAIMHLAR